MPASPLLLVAENVWLATAVLLRSYAERRVEAGVYWYGLRTPSAAVGQVVGIPHQTNRSGNFDVSADDLAALVRGVPEPLVVVAQLHTHPGPGTDHSTWDDERVVSRRVLSLVLPDYGFDANLAAAGVHEFVDGRWRRLGLSEAQRRVALIRTVIDCRR